VITIAFIALHNGHIVLIGIHMVEVHVTNDKYHIVLHHIKKGEVKAHIEVAHSLPHLFTSQFLIINVDHLLGYTIKEATPACDDHLDT
jgi:hypothetical protein